MDEEISIDQYVDEVAEGKRPFIHKEWLQLITPLLDLLGAGTLFDHPAVKKLQATLALARTST